MKIFAHRIRQDEQAAPRERESIQPQGEVDFTDKLLDPETAKLAKGADAVDVYQQLSYTPETLTALHELGINKMSAKTNC